MIEMERNTLEAEWENIRTLRRLLVARKEEWPDWARKVYRDEAGVYTELEKCRMLMEMGMRVEEARLGRMAQQQQQVMYQQQQAGSAGSAAGMGERSTSGFASPKMKPADDFDSFMVSKAFELGK